MTAPAVAARDVALLLCALNLLTIALLPRLFFRRGVLNVQWWITAAPFGAAGVAVLAAALGVPLSGAAAAAGIGSAVTASGAGVASWTALPAALLAAASIALICYTLGTHQRPVSLWHQRDDAPSELVTHGAYSRIRHPFYAAFMLALAGCAAAAPGWLSVSALAFAVWQLNRTAAREEARLLASPFGAAYREYIARTGRFLLRRRQRVVERTRPDVVGQLGTARYAEFAEDVADMGTHRAW